MPEESLREVPAHPVQHTIRLMILHRLAAREVFKRTAVRILIRRDDRITQYRRIRAHILRCEADLLPYFCMVPQRRYACSQMTTGRKAEDSNAVRIGIQLPGMAAHIGNGRARVMLHHRKHMVTRFAIPFFCVMVLALRPRFMHAVPNDKHVKALREKAQRDGFSFPLRAEAVAAAGANHNGRALHLRVNLAGNMRHIAVHTDLRAV